MRENVNQLLIDELLSVCKFALFFMMVDVANLAWLPRVAAQESAFGVLNQLVSPRALDAVPRNDFFSSESLSDQANVHSEELILKVLDSEAFCTLVGQLKPVSIFFCGASSSGSVTVGDVLPGLPPQQPVTS
jgi:hypothetical protein